MASADLEVVSATLVNPPAELLVGETATVTLRTVSSNRGPSAPMDARLNYTATAPAGATVSPALATDTLLALGLDELRVVTEDFTIGCTAGGQPTFTFTSQIQPLHADDTGPSPNNNSASAQLQVECVVPVAINIKPRSFPNSINPADHGQTPVAVLTTRAGEYGLPLDFDARTIDATTVRFGPRALVWAETGGAPDTDGIGRLERSYELNEKTRDADLDMLLHFTTLLTGIQFGDVEACVKGQFVVGGNTFKFFGCDSVRTVPIQ